VPAPRSSARRYPSRNRKLWLFGGGLAACIGLLVFVGYVVGHGPDIGLGGFVESVLSAATGGVTGTIVAFALLAVAAWCVRRLWLERLAAKPGQVFIPVFAADSDLAKKVDPVNVTAQFRQRFASLRIQAPAPVPGAAPESGFLEVLGQKTVDGGNLLASALALVQAARPTYAYIVYGSLVERPGQAKSCGVTVQLVRVPEEGAPPETVWDISWERAVRRAADRAMAHILPRTKRCDAPWASWREFVMPTSLLEAYESAATYEQERRYDQALDSYLTAVERDPMNLALRLAVGHLQEKLGLYVDALATYEGMLAVAHNADGNAYSKTAKYERERALLLARYRRVVLIGGPALGQQWRFTSPGSAWTERDEQRRDVRARVRDGLAAKLAECDADAENVRRLLDEPEPYVDGETDPVLVELRALFVKHALAELESLKVALRAHSDERGETSLALTETSLELTGECLAIRRDWIDRQQTAPQSWIWTRKRVTELTGKIEAIEDSGRLQRWHEHYNAACALALPLLVTSPPNAEDAEVALRDELAAGAVRHLQQATSCADSGYIATRRDWLLSEDPDLDGLRVHPRFKAFEAMYFPGPVATPRRPRHVQRLEVSRYARDLLDATARRWHAEWVKRGKRDQFDDPHELIGWWQDETQAWSIVGRVAWNHRRWRARCDLLETMDALSVRYGGAPLDVAFRRFEEPWMYTVSDEALDEVAEATLTVAGEQLQALARHLADGEPRSGKFGISDFEVWIDKLRDKVPARQAVLPADVQKLCGRHALLWDSLHLWVTACDEATTARAAERFETHLRRLRDNLDEAA
jgi:hypothetical protein